MFRRILAGLSVLLLTAFSLCEARAQQSPGVPSSPEATLKEIIVRVKKDQSFVSLVDYVDWERAFKELSAERRAELKVTTVGELRMFFWNSLAFPTEQLKARLNAEVSSLPAEKREKAKASIASKLEVSARNEAEAKSVIAATEFSIGAVKIDRDKVGDNVTEKATVELRQTFHNRENTAQIPLVKDKGRWLLLTPSLSGALIATNSSPSLSGGPTPSIEKPPAKKISKKGK